MMVGLMKIFSFVLDRSFVLLEKIHFRPGILDKKGVPVEDSREDFCSSPPNNITSWFLTLIEEANLRVVEPGGAYFEIRPVKSLCSTTISRVICSSPATIGFMVNFNSALTDL